MAANPLELGVIKVARPCHRDWAQMSGDARARFCTDCKLTVYNLSEMTTDEARELIREKEGQLCVRFYERTDGTVLTRDCPVGVAKYRRRAPRHRSSVASLSVAGLAAALSQAFTEAPAEACTAMPTPPPGSRVSTTPEPAAADDSWIERRRNAISGSREVEAPRHVMGTIQVIRTP